MPTRTLLCIVTLFHAKYTPPLGHSTLDTPDLFDGNPLRLLVSLAVLVKQVVETQVSFLGSVSVVSLQVKLMERVSLSSLLSQLKQSSLQQMSISLHKVITYEVATKEEGDGKSVTVEPFPGSRVLLSYNLNLDPSGDSTEERAEEKSRGSGHDVELLGLDLVFSCECHWVVHTRTPGWSARPRHLEAETILLVPVMCLSFCALMYFNYTVESESSGSVNPHSQ